MNFIKACLFLLGLSVGFIALGGNTLQFYPAYRDASGTLVGLRQDLAESPDDKELLADIASQEEVVTSFWGSAAGPLVVMIALFVGYMGIFGCLQASWLKSAAGAKAIDVLGWVLIILFALMVVPGAIKILGSVEEGSGFTGAKFFGTFELAYAIIFGLTGLILAGLAFSKEPSHGH